MTLINDIIIYSRRKISSKRSMNISKRNRVKNQDINHLQITHNSQLKRFFQTLSEKRIYTTWFSHSLFIHIYKFNDFLFKIRIKQLFYNLHSVSPFPFSISNQLKFLHSLPSVFHFLQSFLVVLKMVLMSLTEKMM